MATKGDVKSRLKPIVLEILQEECPWVFLQDEPGDDKMFQDDKLYSTKELAEILRISPKTIHNRLKANSDGENTSIFANLPSRLVGRTRMFEGRDLNEWWENTGQQ